MTARWEPSARPAIRPSDLPIRLNEWLGLRQSQTKSSVAVEVAVRHMVHNLPDGPSAGPIGRVELLIGEARDRSPELGGSVGDLLNKFTPLVSADCLRETKSSDWIAKVWLLHENSILRPVCRIHVSYRQAVKLYGTGYNQCDAFLRGVSR